MMQQIEITPNTIRLIGIGAGVFFGLIPLILGLVKKKYRNGIIGFVSSIVGGAILGIYMAIPVAAIFTWLVLRKASAETSENVSSDSNEISETENTSESDVS